MIVRIPKAVRIDLTGALILFPFPANEVSGGYKDSQRYKNFGTGASIPSPIDECEDKRRYAGETCEPVLYEDL